MSDQATIFCADPVAVQDGAPPDADFDALIVCDDEWRPLRPRRRSDAPARIGRAVGVSGIALMIAALWVAPSAGPLFWIAVAALGAGWLLASMD